MILTQWARMPPRSLRALSMGLLPLGDICRISARMAANQWVAREYCGGCGRHQDDHAIDCPAWMEAMEQMRKMA